MFANFIGNISVVTSYLNHGFPSFINIDEVSKEEYGILKEISKLSVDLKESFYSLRPKMELIDCSGLSDDSKIERDTIKQERLSSHISIHNELYDFANEKKCCYFKDVYVEIEKVLELSGKEVLDYVNGNDSFDDIDRNEKYWESAIVNREEMRLLIAKLLETIRLREEHWKGES